MPSTSAAGSSSSHVVLVPSARKPRMPRQISTRPPTAGLRGPSFDTSTPPSGALSTTVAVTGSSHRAAPTGSNPRTFCRYRVRKKSSPNSAKKLNPISTAPRATPGARSRSTGRPGGPGSRDPAAVRRTSPAATTATGALTRNTTGQPWCCTMSPARIGPPAIAAAHAPPQMPSASSSRSRGKAPRSSASAAGCNSAPHRPWSARSTTSSQVVELTATSTETKPKPSTPARKTTSGPRRSARRPAGNSAPASASRYAFAIHWSSPNDAPTDRAMSGPAIVSAVPSNPTIIPPTETATSVHHGLRVRIRDFVIFPPREKATAAYGSAGNELPQSGGAHG